MLRMDLRPSVTSSMLKFKNLPLINMSTWLLKQSTQILKSNLLASKVNKRLSLLKMIPICQRQCLPAPILKVIFVPSLKRIHNMETSVKQRAAFLTLTSKTPNAQSIEITLSATKSCLTRSTTMAWITTDKTLSNS